MSLFKRKRRDDEKPAEGADPATGGDDPTSSAGDGPTAQAPDARADGPYDVSEVGEAGREGRLDVGSLWLPLVEGLEIQPQIDEASNQVTGVMLVLGESAVQVQAFAAPRSEGIWHEVRDEIAGGITEQGGEAETGEGPFGTEPARPRAGHPARRPRRLPAAAVHRLRRPSLAAARGVPRCRRRRPRRRRACSSAPCAASSCRAAPSRWGRASCCR
ncbi:hypothetical protein GCM10025868_05410 [Angustibacter aerolatus]|uniref:DUF3710 domain-containing protein n=1 Tax=Angustibacter aerolatus TaxID=1162965 RepID=A0ABQ6JCG1_9ACTN|nr:DUF3710 domain-containing protein [Angustibacter aerolatus]GMA85291.1 hypothetical protein GCM10025868_05410 [Angustibacter aerolatus]